MSDTVVLTIPARTQNIALARSLAAAMATRADLPIDQVEDVRLAVDEAVSLLLADTVHGADVTCRFRVDGADLGIEVSGPSSSGRVPATDTFSWTVLRALVDEAAATVADGTVTVSLRVAPAVAVEA